MICLNCTHYLPSSEAGQRAAMDDYGFCKAASTQELRARFFHATGECWLKPIRFNRKVPHE